MTDTSLPYKPLSEFPVSANAAFAVHAPLTSNGYSPPLEGVEEEDDSIKCICGYDEDDGDTVFCEICKTWQHIACYYWPGGRSSVPHVHECVNCKPRSIDAHAARRRQEESRILRNLPPPTERKVKRIPSKVPKKRTKDSLAPNGVRASSAQDRGSGSPRDQPPPAKRPKTNHKSSSSTSAPQNGVLPRKRAGSTIAGKSPMKRHQSPTIYNGDYFSTQFMQQCQSSEFTDVPHNSFASMTIANDLSSWLNNSEAFLEVTNRNKHEVLQCWPDTLESLSKHSVETYIDVVEDTNITLNGLHPIHRSVRITTNVDKEAYIGELRGQLGRKEDYKRDSQNRWEELQHPEPYVFFHNDLPVYIDSRSEGSRMRFVRRSCQPNARIQIIMIGEDYHFCLISIREVQQDEEITLGWHMPQKFILAMAKILSKKDLDPNEEDWIANWTSTALANCGDCACARAAGTCYLEKYDRRIHPLAQPVPSLLSEKSIKVKKGKKNGTHISPMSTGRATNSRAASEAVNGDYEDLDNADVRSASASSRSKPASRDNTPGINVGLGVELSDREKRKIQQQERLFEQLEKEEQPVGRKSKKRNSAGSALNTPSVNTSKQLGGPDSTNPSPISPQDVKRPKLNGTVSFKDGHRAASFAEKRKEKPVYVDAHMQTDPEPAEPMPTIKGSCRGSHLQRLLRQIQAERQRGRMVKEERSKTLSADNPISPVSDTTPKSDAAPPAKAHAGTQAMPPPPLPVQSHTRRSASPMRSAVAKAQPAVPDDVEMADAEDAKQEETPKSSQEGQVVDMQAAPISQATDQPPDHPSQKLETAPDLSNDPAINIDPALETIEIATEAAVPEIASNESTLTVPAIPRSRKSPSPSNKGPQLHVQLPPVPAFSNAGALNTPSTLGTPTPNSANPLASPALVQSPSVTFANLPLMSPSLITSLSTNGSSLTQPSPLKKKMSLSDYMARKKGKGTQPSGEAKGPSTGKTGSDINPSLPDQESKSSPAPEFPEDASVATTNLGEEQQDSIMQDAPAVNEAPSTKSQDKPETAMIDVSSLPSGETTAPPAPMMSAPVSVAPAAPMSAATVPMAPMITSSVPPAADRKDSKADGSQEEQENIAPIASMAPVTAESEAPVRLAPVAPM